MMGVVRYILITIALLFALEGVAQKMPERSLVRRGNRQFKRENWERSTDLYQRALQCDTTSFEARYDLASAYYRTERYDAAERMLQSIAQGSTRTERERGEVVYNLGNTQFAQQKYKEALSNYRKAMRFNPDDEDAKFNYAFTKRLIQEQENQQNQNQDQNQDNKDQNQDQNKDNQQQNQDKDNQEQNQGEQPQNQEQSQEQQGEQPQGAMTPEQQEAMLQAIQAEEDKTQDKLKERVGVVVRGTKNW